MIRIADGREVERFLRHVCERLDAYAEVIICTPFIDREFADELAAFAVAARLHACGFRLITSRSAAVAFVAALPGNATNWARTVSLHENLHAKIYVAISRNGGARSIALVTSANLTRAALEKNLELGIEANSTSTGGRRILHQVHTFVRRLCA